MMTAWDDYLEDIDLQICKVLRVIDIDATCTSGAVLLLDFWDALQPIGAGYAAISHTYGLEVYEVFDCRCTCTFLSTDTRADNVVVPPRCSFKQPCPHTTPGALTDTRNRVVNDILNMCANLRDAGVRYAWHDGVCIAQHDKEEVDATISCMGWIYATAMETIVFLHYVGRPMAPIAPRGLAAYECSTSRWHTRVWTIQEAALSRSRRYCVRMCSSGPLTISPVGHGECHDAAEFESKVQELEGKIGLLYKEESSRVEVISEEALWDLCQDLERALEALQVEGESLCRSSESFTCIKEWLRCLKNLSEFVSYVVYQYYSFYFRLGLHEGSLRQSKHIGDRINSILGLARVHDWVVPKDDLHNMEDWTIKFFENVQEEDGLAVATFCINVSLVEKSDRQYIRHSWVPALWRPLEIELVDPEWQEDMDIEYSVLEDGMLELQGELMSMPVRFTLNSQPSLPLFTFKDISGVGMIEADLQQYILAEGSYLPMDLIFQPQAHPIFGEATLSGAVPAPYIRCRMGVAIFPVWECENEERCLDVGGRFMRIRDGESFDAQLVFSLSYLSRHPTRAEAGHSLVLYQPPGAVPQPDADHYEQYFKLGLFRMSQLLISIAMASAHSSTIHELVLI